MWLMLTLWRELPLSAARGGGTCAVRERVGGRADGAMPTPTRESDGESEGERKRESARDRRGRRERECKRRVSSAPVSRCKPLPESRCKPQQRAGKPLRGFA